jgi:hypothetical protein
VTRGSRGSALPFLALLCAALAGSCTDVSTSPTTAAAIEFDSLPFPAVVTGDTLRDSLGRVAPLHAVVLNGAGATIANPAVSYVTLDTGLTIDAAGIVTAQGRSGTVRILASVSGLRASPLQSVAQVIEIARRPDSVIATRTQDTTLVYTIPDSVAKNVTALLSVRVATNDTSGGITGTKAWLVSYQAFWHGQALSPSDTTLASLWDDGSRISGRAVTGADGSAGRRLRVRSLLLPTTPDSFIVVATVRYRGADVRGSPVRFVIHTRPR